MIHLYCIAALVAVPTLLALLARRDRLNAKAARLHDRMTRARLPAFRVF